MVTIERTDGGGSISHSNTRTKSRRKKLANSLLLRMHINAILKWMARIKLSMSAFHRSYFIPTWLDQVTFGYNNMTFRQNDKGVMLPDRMCFTTDINQASTPSGSGRSDATCGPGFRRKIEMDKKI